MLHQLKRIPVNTVYLYAGSLLAGALNYLYNLLMAREAFLGPSEYGALAALTSLLYLGGISAATLTTTTTNYIASIVGREQSSQIGYFIRQLSRYVFLFGLVIGVFFITASPFLAQHLKLNSALLPMLLAPILLLALLGAITLGALQGLTLFGTLAILFAIGASLRLLLSWILVGPLQLGITGALLATLAAAAIVYGLSVLPLRQYLKQTFFSPASKPVFRWRELVGYTHSVFWVTLGITSLFSLDIILAQHYLTNQEASQYSAFSTLGRIIYFTTLPLIMIMFPLVTRRFAAARSSRSVIIMSGLGVVVISLVALGVFSTVPGLVIRYSIGDAYQAASSTLWLFGLFFAVVSASTWLIHIFLARRTTLVAYLAPAAVILQIVLISRWHESPRHIVISSLVAASALLAGLLISVPVVKSASVRQPTSLDQLATNPDGYQNKNPGD